jgi:hypothetical protein
MYVNGKMRPVETIPGMGGGGRENDEGDEFNVIYLIHCKDFCKCHSAPTAQFLKNTERKKKTAKKNLQIPAVI